MIHWNIAAIVGVSGVGKTSLCTCAAKVLGYRYVNYGNLMLDVARSLDLALNRDELFNLDIKVQESIWKTAAYKIKDMQLSSNKILVDLHGVDQSNIGYIISLPIGIISPDIIIIVESSYENIIYRRRSDKIRNRRLESLEYIMEYMNILRMSMVAYSVIYGSNLVILENDDFKICLDEIVKILC
ncbi:MAG: AAA family ATPase [Methanobacterium sp.]|nr:AAA family ATPase [Methanobacterium sp.]